MAIIEEIIERSDVLATVEAIKKEGNILFGKGEWEGAADKYKNALDQCPMDAKIPRSLLLSNLSAALIKQQQWDAAAEAACRAIEADVPNEKALERRAFAYSNMSDKYEKAIEDYEELKNRFPLRSDYSKRIAEIQTKIAQRNEEMKKDMLAKLKGLGDMCLRPFGLSTDNFQMIPNGDGGYSISMKNVSNSSQDNQ